MPPLGAGFPTGTPNRSPLKGLHSAGGSSTQPGLGCVCFHQNKPGTCVLGLRNIQGGLGESDTHS